jgi:triacylglycerol esterase/lipase EstA (alpha/beta hydrolase family)
MIVVVVVGFAALAVRAMSASTGPASADQALPGTVILVPGYGGSQAALSALADRLRASGRAATVLTLPGDGTGDLGAQADALDAAVSGALRAGAPSVDLIGYSAGGVVIRLWVDRHADTRAARRVVTLGAPLHGASIAAVGSALVPGACPTACRQLAPGSSLLSQLDTARLPADLPWLSVWTRDDETVTPPDSARLDGAVNIAVQDVCPNAHVQHGQLPTDPLVTGLVLRALNDPQPLTGPPGAGACAELRSGGQ